MKRRGIFITSILFIFLLLIENMGFSADLKDYKPKSPDEEAIVSLLNKWKESMESRNLQGILDMLHDDAKIMLRGGPYPVKIATKEEAKTALPGDIEASGGGLKLETPKIDASGKEANVEISLVIPEEEGVHGYYNYLYWFNLVKENNRWSIMSWKYRGQ
jgi:ketosteroid isomerase-like protein